MDGTGRTRTAAHAQSRTVSRVHRRHVEPSSSSASSSSMTLPRAPTPQMVPTRVAASASTPASPSPSAAASASASASPSSGSGSFDNSSIGRMSSAGWHGATAIIKEHGSGEDSPMSGPATSHHRHHHSHLRVPDSASNSASASPASPLSTTPAGSIWRDGDETEASLRHVSSTPTLWQVASEHGRQASGARIHLSSVESAVAQSQSQSASVSQNHSQRRAAAADVSKPRARRESPRRGGSDRNMDSSVATSGPDPDVDESAAPSRYRCSTSFSSQFHFHPDRTSPSTLSPKLSPTSSTTSESAQLPLLRSSSSSLRSSSSSLSSMTRSDSPLPPSAFHRRRELLLDKDGTTNTAAPAWSSIDRTMKRSSTHIHPSQTNDEWRWPCCCMKSRPTFLQFIALIQSCLILFMLFVAWHWNEYGNGNVGRFHLRPAWPATSAAEGAHMDNQLPDHDLDTTSADLQQTVAEVDELQRRLRAVEAELIVKREELAEAEQRAVLSTTQQRGINAPDVALASISPSVLALAQELTSPHSSSDPLSSSSSSSSSLPLLIPSSTRFALPWTPILLQDDLCEQKEFHPAKLVPHDPECILAWDQTPEDEPSAAAAAQPSSYGWVLRYPGMETITNSPDALNYPHPKWMDYALTGEGAYVLDTIFRYGPAPGSAGYDKIWQPKLPAKCKPYRRFEPVTFLKALTGRTLAILGDSMSQICMAQLFASLAPYLRAHTLHRKPSSLIRKPYMIFYYEYNVTIKHAFMGGRSPVLMQEAVDIYLADILVANFGAAHNRDDEQMEQSFNTAFKQFFTHLRQGIPKRQLPVIGKDDGSRHRSYIHHYLPFNNTLIWRDYFAAHFDGFEANGEYTQKHKDLVREREEKESRRIRGPKDACQSMKDVGHTMVDRRKNYRTRIPREMIMGHDALDSASSTTSSSFPRSPSLSSFNVTFLPLYGSSVLSDVSLHLTSDDCRHYRAPSSTLEVFVDHLYNLIVDPDEYETEANKLREEERKINQQRMRKYQQDKEEKERKETEAQQESDKTDKAKNPKK